VNEVVDSRLALAKALRELADGSSEAALRSALSRSYYSIFHAANVLLGKVTHEDIAEKLGEVDPELGARVKELRRLRSLADYTPGFIDLEYGGDVELFKQEARDMVNEGLRVFDRIVREIEQRSRSGN
jgi:uncharacterized protein (UPF0332 family)